MATIQARGVRLLILLSIPLAGAYTLEGWAWPANVPVEVHWTGAVEGLTHDELTTAVDGAAAAWTNAAPCTFSFTPVEDEAADQWFADGGIAVLVGDPDDELAVGVQAVSYTQADPYTGDESPPGAGRKVVFNDGDIWVPDSAIDAQQCSNHYSLQAWLTHELGYVAGLGPSCTEPDCTYDETGATMYGAPAECDNAGSSPNDDDIAGLNAIYGTSGGVRLACGPDPDDGLTVTCSAQADADIASMAPIWDFGDGATLNGGDTATHTYGVVGEYRVQLCVSPPECGRTSCVSTYFQALTYANPGGHPPLPDPLEIGCSTTLARTSTLGALLGCVALFLRRRA